jgi:DNA repair exonuclease SbcCD ATPase subunit
VPRRISSSSVQATNLARAADELYALAPAAFTAARDERASQARAAGDASLATEIRKLRRPTVSAWLVNLLAREAAGKVDDLLELGQSLREAQRALDGDLLRDLSAQRRQLVAAISQEVKRLADQAGQAVSAQVEREVRDTLEAALADPAAADAVRSGRLTSPISYAGLGEGIGVGDAVAAAPAPAPRSPREAPRPARGGGKQAVPAKREAEAAGRAQREAEAAERARQEAEAAERNRLEAAEDVREARAGLDAAEQEVTSARGEHEALQRRIEELERQLGELQAESAERLRALRHAQRSRDIAARALDGALRRLARAEAKASQHRS